MQSETVSVDVMALPPRTIDDVARQQIRTWLQATGITQVAFAMQIHRNQEWVSRYLNGVFDADLTTLQQMAAVFGHNLAVLFGNLPTNPDEAILLTLFRSLRAEGRKAVLTMLQEWTRARARHRPKTR